MKTQFGSTIKFGIVIGLFVCALSSFGLSQNNYFSLAQQQSQQARQTYKGLQYSVDQPLWRQALAYLELAYEAEPTNLEVLRYATLTYAEVGWNSRSWRYGQRYIQAGGRLDTALVDAITDVGNDLGYTFYQFQNFESALDYFYAVNEINPTNKRAIRWIARINNESGNIEQALVAWRQLAALDPTDSTVTYFINFAEQQVAWGKEAGQAYMEGLSFYETNNLEQANQSFVQATELNNDYLDAYRWAARTFQELGDKASALNYWRSARQLSPNDESIHYFIGVLKGEITE